MRIVLWDALLEGHLSVSLGRALRARGHHVLETGRIGTGFTYISDATSLARCTALVDRVLDESPDAVLVFRPSTLPPRLLRRMRRSGAHLAVWLSDDPVLWNFTYRPSIDLYDTVLHCGSERVLQFYDDYAGRAVGVNLPFWADEEEFPYVYGTRAPASTAIFLGNVDGPLRRRRYEGFGALRTDLLIYGRTGNDEYGIGAGYLDSPAEVVDAASRARIAITIPQFFADHRGSATWFEGLDTLGTFQFPSRVVQYAAMGLPIVSVTPDASDLDTFPEISTVSDIPSLDRAIDALLHEDQLPDISRRTHKRFRRHFSAAARAIAIESVLHDDSWRTLSAPERARWFTQFDALGTESATAQDHGRVCDTAAPSPATRARLLLGATPSPTTTPAPAHLRICVIGNRTDRATAAINVTTRALRHLGHSVVEVDASQALSQSQHSPAITVGQLLPTGNLAPDAVIIVGAEIGFAESDREQLRSAGIPVMYHAVQPVSSSAMLMRIARQADAASFASAPTAELLLARGFPSVFSVPPLVDGAFRELCRNPIPPGPRIRVIGGARERADLPEGVRQDLLEMHGENATDDALAAPLRSLEDVHAHVSAATTVVTPDHSTDPPQSHELLPFALAAGGLVVLPRLRESSQTPGHGTSHLLAHAPGELLRKLQRLSDDASRRSAIIARAQKTAAHSLSAERALSRLLDTAFASVAENQHISQPDIVCHRHAPPPGPVSMKTWRLTAPTDGASFARVALHRLRPVAHAPTSSFRLDVLIDNETIATSPLREVPDSSQLVLSFPAGMPRRSLRVRLCVTERVRPWNWASATAFRVALTEGPLSNAPKHLTITATTPCFSTPVTTSPLNDVLPPTRSTPYAKR